MFAGNTALIVRSLVLVFGLALAGLLLAAGMEVQSANAALLAELFVLAAWFGAVALVGCHLGIVRTLYPPLAAALTAAGLLWPQSLLAIIGPGVLFGVALLLSVGPGWKVR